MGILDRFRSLFASQSVDVYDRFEILRKAVSGTMSKFYMARERKTGKIVGLKIADLDKVALFESRFKELKKPSEGEIAIGLSHPLVVKTYEHGVSKKGEPYLVMEFIQGPGLHQLLHNRDPIIEGHRLRLIRQMAEALQYVHEQEYIHRDICPRNFIYETESGDVKLIDFGLTLPARREFMQPGNRTGTPLYMAPEVVRRRWTDHRLDIFAMGVSAYQICTYEFPWPGTETTGRAALAHDTHDPKDILQWRPNLNRILAKAIMQCIEANPNNRPQSVAEFLKRIRPVDVDDRPE
ncbi:MAG: serine/threonine protein kinase [Planctomycetes bacterium]|nr:serine/threonine protein kinase [Planctomycetota bacterium]